MRYDFEKSLRSLNIPQLLFESLLMYAATICLRPQALAGVFCAGSPTIGLLGFPSTCIGGMSGFPVCHQIHGGGLRVYVKAGADVKRHMYQGLLIGREDAGPSE